VYIAPKSIGFTSTERKFHENVVRSHFCNSHLARAKPLVLKGPGTPKKKEAYTTTRTTTHQQQQATTKHNKQTTNKQQHTTSTHQQTTTNSTTQPHHAFKEKTYI
jgi:hypothetical protein